MSANETAFLRGNSKNFLQAHPAIWFIQNKQLYKTMVHLNKKVSPLKIFQHPLYTLMECWLSFLLKGFWDPYEAFHLSISM